MLVPLTNLVGECGHTKVTKAKKTKKVPWHWDKVHQQAGFYIYGRFWSPSANGHQKNGLYNIFYERLENTKKILNISSLKMHQHLVLMSVYFKTGYIN